MRRFVRRLVALFRNDQAEADLAREVESHIALLEERFLQDGLPPDEARRAARRAFGGVEQAKEYQRDARSFRWIDDARQDVTYGARSFARSPGFTAAAAITLALGIGAATTIFGALYAISLRQLPYHDPDRIVRVFEYLPPREGSTAPRRGHPFSPASLNVVRQASTLSHVAMELPRLMVMVAGDMPARVGGSRVSADMFNLLGAHPLVGRALQDADETPGADNVVIISHALWRQQFAGDTAIGATVTLDGRPHTIVGVMPPDFQFPPGSTGDVYLPLVAAGAAPTFRLPFYARLRDGATLAAAQQEIGAIYDSVRSTTPDNRPRLEVIAAKDVLIEPVKPAILVLMIAVVLVLLIACVNVANLVLARSTVRRYEMALRSALGASRARLLRQHLTEGTLLAMLAGIGGAAIAAVCISWLKAVGNTGPRRDMLSGLNIPRLADITVDLTVVSFAMAISLLAGLAFGVIASLRRPASLVSGLRRDVRGSLLGRRGVQHVLVVSEVAMAVMLFIGATLMTRSFLHLASIDTGFNARGLLTFQATLPPARPLSALTRFGEDMVARLAELPGVRGAAYAESLPMVPVGRMAMLSTTPSFPKLDPQARTTVDVRIVSHGYLGVMNIRVIAGRSLTAGDDAGRPRVLVINATLARSMFGGNAVGQRVYVGGVATFDPPGRTGALEPWEIVGVVADVRQRSVLDAPAPQIFVDHRQVPGPTNDPAINVVTRVDGETAPLLASLRPMAAQLDPQALVENVAPMDQVVSSTFARPRLYALVLGIYAFVAISLAAMGVYGVIAFGVVQRTREIGIRMALGAGGRQVRALIARDSAIVAGAGLLIGIGGAIWSSRLFTGLLFGISPLDVSTYAAVAVAFAVIVALAAFVPARRASAVDPVSALRAE